MARGDKGYDKVVRKVNKGGKSQARIKAVHSMVENIIQGDSEAAADDLRTAIQLISREIVLGEAADDKSDEDTSDKSDEDKSEDSEEESDDDDSDGDESDSDDDSDDKKED